MLTSEMNITITKTPESFEKVREPGKYESNSKRFIFNNSVNQ